METQIFIKVGEAISAFNRENPKNKLTLQSLGARVFAGEKLLREETKAQYLSRWQHGKLLQHCKIIHVVRISQATGMPINELVYVTQ